MPLKSYTRIWITMPITPKSIVQLRQIWRSLAEKYGGATYSQIALPSVFVGTWFDEENEVYVEDYISVFFIDVDIEKYPNFLDEFENLKKEIEGVEKPLGESKIWIVVDNVYLLE